MKAGDKVTYIPFRGCSVEQMENGVIKRLTDDEQGAFVVYNCNGEWDKIEDYTAANTNFRNLLPDWTEGARNRKFTTDLNKEK